MREHAWIAALAVLVGCTTTVRGETPFGGGGGTPDGGQAGAETGDVNTTGQGDGAPGGGSEGGGTEGGDDGSGGADDDGVKLDVSDPGNADDGGTNNGPGCEKADFLFVIDNSGSMGDEQQALIASFPGFISTIQDTLQAQDYHVMVVDTDATGGGSTSTSCINGVCTCSPSPACCDSVCQFSDTCNGFPCDDLPGGDCDGEIGAGKIFREDGTVCLPEDGPRYMDDSTADLAAEFACVAEVGTFGSGSEVPMESMVTAVSDPMNQPGACNDSFLRDDAILVVTFITDEEDEGKSPGTPADWHQDLVDAKGGNEDAIVVLGLFGDHDQPGGICNNLDEAEPAPRLREFVESFDERGFVGSVCAADYNDFFEEAVQVIDLACDEFEPEG